MPGIFRSDSALRTVASLSILIFAINSVPNPIKSCVLRLSNCHTGLLLRGIALSATLVLSSCSPSKYLGADWDGKFLVSNKVVIKSDTPLSSYDKSVINAELEPQYRQKPGSGSVIAFPLSMWLHYGQKDSKVSFIKWISKKIDAPVVLDTALAKRTSINFQNQMRQRGYFKASCNAKPQLVGKYKASVRYNLALGPLYKVSNVEFTSKDSLVRDLVNFYAGESLIQKDAPLDARLFESERLRITAVLKNQGYAYFVPQFVQFTGDSTGTTAKVRVNILPFSDSVMHQTYRIGKVEVYSGVVPEVTALRRDTFIDSVYFAAVEPLFFVRPDRIVQKIRFRPGDIYDQSKFDKTLENLNALGVYRFVSMRPSQDSLQPGVIDVVINVSPNKRFTPGGDIDLSYSTLNGGLIGISPSFYFTNRNIFSGAEHWRTTANYNTEFDISAGNLIYAREFKIQNELTIPRYFDYLGMWKALYRRHLVTPLFYMKLKTEGSARISANYDYLRVTNFYQFHLLNASFGYNLRIDNHNQVNWNHIGVDVLRPQFASSLTPSKFLELSFDNQLFTGFLLRSFNYSHSSRTTPNGSRWNYRLGFEMSGLEVLAANRVWGAIAGRKEWQVGSLKFSEYIRLDQDLTYMRNFSENTVLALRAGMGIASNFGDSRTVPYVKQYFVGGPSSVRAWRIRELGPGGYVDINPETGLKRDIQPYYQAGDFRFEMNAELRFPLFPYFRGAVFLDAGNIWTIREDTDRPGSQLNLDSYKNIALGTGFGIRGDFDYFVIRFDFGLPLRNPYPDPVTGKYWVPDLVSKLQIRDFNPNLAVGYPF